MTPQQSSREIKFRCWDNNKMYYHVQAGGFEYTVPSIYVKRNGAYEWFDCTPESIVMQFTGLKDKNGAEIYEGDILRSIGDGFEVIFQDGCFAGKHKNSKGWIDLRIFNDKRSYKKLITIWEVIGNIYQNPELINDKTE